ncbi:cache domain-containing protein [Rufibacter radiotolerans]|uniref:cache domain-containing protein n=1 Tax=Rufibacter radiotolerans TaxID=1379910 RepID=UPI0006647C3F|nr:cache domain-containing protein [Rufibacter radiotolerans]
METLEINSKETASLVSAPPENKDTSEVTRLVQDAVALVEKVGEAAFKDFKVPDSRWRQGETYVFVLDLEGNMLVHPEPDMEGKNQLDLKDLNGKSIVWGLIGATKAHPDKPEGWFHYQWPKPGELLPRWKSSYVHQAKAPNGKTYVIGSGMYDNRMEREFVADLVLNAVGEIEQHGKAAFPLFHDPKSQYLAKDAYIFVMDLEGNELVNPAFPTIEGRNILDYKDTKGKYLIKDILEIVNTKGEGWVDYMWPKPGESVSSQKSAYVHKALLDGKPMAVGCGVYLPDAPKGTKPAATMTAPELMNLVRQAADLLQQQGEEAYPQFREKNSKWLNDETYFFVLGFDGTRVFHAAEPTTEGINVLEQKDALGKPMIQMMLEAGASPGGEGWVHYQYPQPGYIFPTWKSTFVKQVTYPSGQTFIIGCGVYHLQLDKAMIEDLVNRAALLVAEKGQDAFGQLRDKTGPFYFMDTYVFVQTPEGVELVNPAQPSLEGKNLMKLKDLKGKEIVRIEISTAMTDGRAWLECYWYQPGSNTPALKQTYVQKVQAKDGKTYIVGSGLYGGDGPSSKDVKEKIQKSSWEAVHTEELTDLLKRQVLFGEKTTLARFQGKDGAEVERHQHVNEENTWVLSGTLKYVFDDREVVVRTGEIILVPPDVPHSVILLEDTDFVTLFSPGREDWLQGQDQYLRNQKKPTEQDHA